MTEIEIRQTVKLVIRFPEDKRPRFRAPYHSTRYETAWDTLVAATELPWSVSTIRVSGSGRGIKANGEVGKIFSSLRFATLHDLPDDVRKMILDALADYEQEPTG